MIDADEEPDKYVLEVVTVEGGFDATEEVGSRRSWCVAQPAHVIIADDNHHFILRPYCFYITDTVALQGMNAHSISFRPNRKTWRCRRKGVSVRS